MKDGELDSVDERILLELQREGRATITQVAEPLPVSANTVRNRISAMEEAGVIERYTIRVDYTKAGLPFHYQFTCTAPIAERSRLVEAAFDIEGVLNVRELMTGRRNVIVEAVGERQDDVTRIAETLDDLGLEVLNQNMIKRAETRPLSVWVDDVEGDDGGTEADEASEGDAADEAD